MSNEFQKSGIEFTIWPGSNPKVPGVQWAIKSTVSNLFMFLNFKNGVSDEFQKSVFEFTLWPGPNPKDPGVQWTIKSTVSTLIVKTECLMQSVFGFTDGDKSADPGVHWFKFRILFSEIHSEQKKRNVR